MPTHPHSVPRRRTHHADVMVSSTSLDLPKHRKAAIDAIWRRDMFPLAMEAGVASPTDAIQFSLEMVDEAEVYIGIIGCRYGHRPSDAVRNPDDLSITELELRRAEAREIPVLIFIMADEHPGPTVGEAKTFYESSAKGKKKLEKLKADLKARYVVSFFSSVDQLGAQIYQALSELIERGVITPQETTEDEKDSDLPRPPEPFVAHPYILTQTFVGRREELKRLDEWAASGDTTMIVEAIGGLGKSALTWEWFNTRPEGQFAGRLWWSFYESDSAVTNFTRHTLAYLTGQPLDFFTNMAQDERERTLLTLLCAKPYLLVLDGIERVLVAYHRLDAPHITDEQVKENLRGCTDPRHSQFLQKLIACAPTKILISTRLIPADLENKAGQLLPGVQKHHLNGLANSDALLLLCHLGVSGNERDMLRFTRQFENHSLLLTVIAGRINDYRPAPGSFDAWYPAEGHSLRLSDPELSQRRTHILQYALDGLPPELRKLLAQASAFRYALDYETISAFNPYVPPKPPEVKEPRKPDTGRYSSIEIYRLYERLDQAANDEERAAIQQQIDQEVAKIETDYQQRLIAYQDYQQALAAYLNSAEYRAGLEKFHKGLKELEDRGLLQWDRAYNRYDLHPVVRGYAQEGLQGDERQSTYERIRDHFERVPPKKLEEVRELDDLRRDFEIYHALIGAGLLDRAAEFYGSRLGEVLQYQLAAYPTIVELLTPLFPDGTDNPPCLSSVQQQCTSMTDLANAFFLLGQNRLSLTLKVLTIKIDLDRKYAPNLRVDLSNYSHSLQNNNHLAAAQRTLDLVRDLAEAAGDARGLAMSYLDLLSIYQNTGQWMAAEQAYQVFNTSPPTYQREFWQTDAEFCRAEMLISQELDAAEALDRAWTLAFKSQNALGQRVIYSLRGEVALQRGDPAAAAGHFQDAITLARKHGSATLAGYLGGLARARALQGQGDEARQIIETLLQEQSEDKKLHLDAAEVYLTLSEREQAAEHALAAYREAWADGPPFSWWWDLERAKKVLSALGIDPPTLPPFDPAKVEKIPHEDEIRAFIEELRAKPKDEKPFDSNF
ncbi:MAG: DUF4062 domain-containing protein [Chloroflexi bacterium]|nr:DUF4062 domain-containing protein [Chloroflexota bacterium]